METESDGILRGQARRGDRRRLRHGPRAGPPARGAGLLGRGVRLAPGRHGGNRVPGAGGRRVRRPGHQPRLRRLRRGAGAALPRRAARAARQRSRRPGLRQRGHRRRGQLRQRQPGGVGAHVRRRLVGRVLLRPDLPAAADRQRRRGAGQHQQRERPVGGAGPGHAEHRLLRGQVRGAGLHRGADRGPAQQRAPGPGGRGDAGSRGHRHHREHPPRARQGPGAADEAS